MTKATFKKIATCLTVLLMALTSACNDQHPNNQHPNNQHHNNQHNNNQHNNNEHNKKPDSQTQTKTVNITVTDFAGNTISLAKPAERIIALAPHIVENLFTVGAGDQIVGVVSHSDYPSEALKLPIVGGYEQTNFERIVELKPDLIVAWESGNTLSSISKLRELGFTVLIDQPDNLDDIATSLRMLAKVTGKTERGEQAAAQFINSVNKARARSKDLQTVSVFYQVWDEPLISINGNHIISDAIRACGGHNILHDEAAVAPRVNVESIIALDPQAIIASGMGEARPEWLDLWRQWPDLTAVKNQHLFYVNPDYLQRHTARQLLAIDEVCAQLDQVRSHGE